MFNIYLRVEKRISYFAFIVLDIHVFTICRIFSSEEEFRVFNLFKACDIAASALVVVCYIVIY